MRYWILAMAVVVLIVLQQDYWLWDDTTLVFGFLPGCLAWHMSVSVAAAVVWLLAVKFAWPDVAWDSHPELPDAREGNPAPHDAQDRNPKLQGDGDG